MSDPAPWRVPLILSFCTVLFIAGMMSDGMSDPSSPEITFDTKFLYCSVLCRNDEWWNEWPQLLREYLWYLVSVLFYSLQEWWVMEWVTPALRRLPLILSFYSVLFFAGMMSDGMSDPSFSESTFDTKFLFCSILCRNDEWRNEWTQLTWEYIWYLRYHYEWWNHRWCYSTASCFRFVECSFMNYKLLTVYTEQIGDIISIFGSNMIFYALTSAELRGRCWNPRLSGSGFNISRGAQ